MIGAKKFQALTNSNLRGNTSAEFLSNQMLKNASVSRPYLPIGRLKQQVGNPAYSPRSLYGADPAPSLCETDKTRNRSSIHVFHLQTRRTATITTK
jgi:hypothetical protein